MRSLIIVVAINGQAAVGIATVANNDLGRNLNASATDSNLELAGSAAVDGQILSELTQVGGSKGNGVLYGLTGSNLGSSGSDAEGSLQGTKDGSKGVLATILEREGQLSGLLGIEVTEGQIASVQNSQVLEYFILKGGLGIEGIGVV